MQDTFVGNYEQFCPIIIFQSFYFYALCKMADIGITLFIMIQC